MNNLTVPARRAGKASPTAEGSRVLTELVTRFTPKRNKLAARIQQQQDIDNGKLPDLFPRFTLR